MKCISFIGKQGKIYEHAICLVEHSIWLCHKCASLSFSASVSNSILTTCTSAIKAEGVTHAPGVSHVDPGPQEAAALRPGCPLKNLARNGGI